MRQRFPAPNLALQTTLGSWGIRFAAVPAHSPRTHEQVLFAGWGSAPVGPPRCFPSPRDVTGAVRQRGVEVLGSFCRGTDHQGASAGF